MIRDPRAALLDDEVLNRVLRGLPHRVPPAGLATSLRVLASRRHGWSRIDRLRLFADNLMRPLALPLAGGVFATVILFSMWLIPTYSIGYANNVDVPTMLTTEAAVKGTGPIGASGQDVIVDVTVNGEGRMVDYTIVCPRNILKDAAWRRNLENMLLFTEFTPATSFGQPTAGKMRLSLRPLSHIDVKG